MITWNLDEKKQISLSFLKKNIGKTLLITYNKIALVFTLKYVNFFIEKNIQEPILALTSEEKERLYVIRILFVDFLNNPKKNQPNSIYIASISKKDGLISGTESVEFAIKIGQRIKGVEKLALHDGATIDCDIEEKFDLSLYRLLVKDETFYNKFGFKLWYFDKYQQKSLEKYGRIISSYKVINIIKEFEFINKLIMGNSVDKIKYQYVSFSDFIIDDSNNNTVEYAWRFISNNLIIIEILKKFKKYTFGKTVSILNEKDCVTLSILFKNFDDQNFYIPSLVIKGEKYLFKFKAKLLKLLLLRKNFGWQGFYVKEI